MSISLQIGSNAQAIKYANLESHCGEVSKAVHGSRDLATREHFGSIRWLMGSDVLCYGCITVAYATPNPSGRWISYSGIHYIPRLWAWFLFQNPESQSYIGLHFGSSRVYSIFPMEMGTFHSSLDIGESGPQRHRGCMDHDGERILGITQMEANCVSIYSQPNHPFWIWPTWFIFH